MNDLFKTISSLIILSLVLTMSFNLINSFNQQSRINELASDLNELSLVIKSLKNIASKNSWQQVSVSVPDNYTLRFSNETNQLIINGSENINLSINAEITYGLELSEGEHLMQVYYGTISFNELKNNTLVIQ